MNRLDNQMKHWSLKLQNDLKISSISSEKLASAISREVSELSEAQKKLLIESSVISVQNRLDELNAFQSWMDFASNAKNNPGLTRAQVITQNYICFVYLSEAWFRELRKTVASGTATKQCCKFLTDNPIRAFRNAISHSNWCYKSDFSGIEYWARKGDDSNEAMTKFEVSQSELNFWQSLARCTAYASYLSIVDSAKDRVAN
jgi:hypothetical protein